MATTQPTSCDDGVFVDMDATLWGELQSYIDLSMIYFKLPLTAFFRLRQVCKEWNRLASDRQFLEQTFKTPISNPYFVVTNRRTGHRLLTYQASSWCSTALPQGRCEVSGLLYEDSDRNRVFDLHTRVFYTLPPLPAMVEVLPLIVEPEDCEDPLIGMTVDTTVVPYSFRVILADQVIGTGIYDSKSGAWMHKPSTYYEYSAPVEGTQSCVHYSKFLYIRDRVAPGAAFDLHTYDLERDEWDCQVPGVPEDVWPFCDIGVWRDRLFVFGMKIGPVLTGWEISNDFEDPWTLFDCMPGDLCEWVVGGEEETYVNIQSKFCGEYVLVYNCVGVEERAVLYNLDRKTWEKVELPAPPVSS